MTWQGLSQRQRVLRLLRQRGEAGVTAVDFAAPNVADGGPPIMRVAARIEELRSDGLPIANGGWHGPVKRYVLVDLEPAAAPAAPAGDDAGRLFDPDPPQPRSAYEDAA